MAGGIGIRKLTDNAVKSFVSKAEVGKKLADGGGLFLFITPARSATWRIKYRIAGKEKLYSVGIYPLISLAAARVELYELKSLLLQNKDPMIEKRVNKIIATTNNDNTFKSVSEEWFAFKKKEWSDVHYRKSVLAFEKNLYPLLANLPIGNISPAIAAKAIEDIYVRGVLETATRVLQHLNSVFRYAQAKGLCRDNPAAPVREVLPRKKTVNRMPALLDFVSLGSVLREAEMAKISHSVRIAQKLCAFTAARIGNVITAEWHEFVLDEKQSVWVIPRAKMKVNSRDIDHRIPLGPEMTKELLHWKQMTGGNGFVFPSPTGNNHIGREGIEKLYRVTLKLDGKHTPHGWRSSFSTLARDKGFERDVVELALDHAHDNEVARAYDRGERFEQRIELYQWWDFQLSNAQKGAKIIPMTGKEKSSH